MSHSWWYLARSSGLTAWVLLVASLVMGTMATGRLTERTGSRRWLLDLHPWVSGLALSAVVLHILAIVADSYVKISLTQALVPFASSWRSTAVAWGAIAFWLMVAVQGTSLVRHSMPKRVWHGIHLSAYLLAVLATLHAVLTGTDVHNRFVTVLIAGGVTIAVASSLQRAFGVGRMRRAEQRARTAPGRVRS
jgi:DMSO/TMAO reductase YedYZ heme-binding membrane subunit